MEEQNKIKAANTIANWWRNIYNFKTQIWGESMLENYCYNDDSRDSYDDNFLTIEEKLMEKKFSDYYMKIFGTLYIRFSIIFFIS